MTSKRELFLSTSIPGDVEENPYFFEVRDLIKLQSDELVEQDDDEDELTAE